MLRSILSTLKARMHHDTLAEKAEAYLIGFQVSAALHDPFKLQELIDSLEPCYYRVTKRMLAQTNPDAYANVAWRTIDK